MKNRNDISCKNVRESLLTQNSEKLNDPVKQHLKSCQKCREFQQLLIDISESTQITGEELHPDPRILESLKINLKVRTAASANKQASNFFNPLVDLFRKRIPVYQVLMAVFVAAIFYFSISKINISNAKPDKLEFSSQVEAQMVESIEFPVQPQLDQTHQIGKSLAEDSVLAKFRVSVL